MVQKPEPLATPSPRRLRVATYNIHAGAGRDRRLDLERVRDVIHELEADVIALQEVHGMAVLDLLAAATGYRTIAGPTLLRHGENYGNAVLTSLPVERVERIDLTVGRHEP